MRNKIYIIAFCCIILGGCTTPKYILKKESEIIQLDLGNSIENYIPMSDELLQKSAILDSSYNLLCNQKYSAVENYIANIEKSGNLSVDFYLAKTLLLISEKDYSNAYTNLLKVNGKDYSVLIKLLSTDLEYEMSKVNGVVDYNSFLKDYQELIDMNPDNSALKKIIAIRLRYLRYNY